VGSKLRVYKIDLVPHVEAFLSLQLVTPNVKQKYGKMVAKGCGGTSFARVLTTCTSFAIFLRMGHACLMLMQMIKPSL
jgi:hypothetical protein